MSILDNFDFFKKKRTVVKKEDDGTSFTVMSYLGGEHKVKEEDAESIPTFAYCSELITSSIAQLKFYLCETQEDGSIKILEDDYRNYLVNTQANDMLTGYNFKKNIAKNLLYYGASYNVVEHMKNSNYINGIYPLDTTKISIKKYVKGYKTNAEIIYHGVNGKITFIPEQLNIILKDTDDGVSSIGVLERHADILNLALKEIVYSNNVIDNGGILSGILTTPNKINKVARQGLRDSITQFMSGSKNAGKIMVLENGMDYKQVSSKPNDLQITESKKNTISEISRICCIPESMVNANANKYGSLEQNNLQFLQTTLTPFIKIMETAFDRDLLLESEKGKKFWRCDVSDILKVSEQDKVDAIAKAKNEGIISINEARKKLGQPLLEKDFFVYKIGQCMFHYEENTVTSLNTCITVDLNAPVQQPPKQGEQNNNNQPQENEKENEDKKKKSDSKKKKKDKSMDKT